MIAFHNRSVRLAREVGLVALGLILAAIPLALWVAWSEAMLYGVLAVCALATALFVLLTRVGSADDETPPVAPNRDLRRTLSPEFISELQRLQPLTYHHRRLGDMRLWNKFRRLRALMRQPDD